MTEVPTVDRARVLAFRVVTHGLDRTGSVAADLPITDLGLPDMPVGSAALSVAARTPGGADDDIAATIDDARSWAAAWSVRGAPHRHRAGDLRSLAAALWPADDADAVARLAGNGQQIRKAGEGAVDALRTTAEALARVITEPTVKGDASTAVTKELPEHCVAWCRGCGVTHVGEQLMRLASLPAGLRIVPGTSPPVLTPIARWPGPPDRQDGAGAVVEAYLRLHGPATPGDVAAYLQTTQKAVKAAWPDGLAAVAVDGRRAWLPEERLDDLLSAPEPHLVRLLPRGDPWLQARDRLVIAPDKARHKILWPILGAPGCVLVDGEMVGAWRTKASGRRLGITVAAFRRLAPAVRKQVEAEAGRVATVRGAVDVRVTFEDA